MAHARVSVGVVSGSGSQRSTSETRTHARALDKKTCELAAFHVGFRIAKDQPRGIRAHSRHLPVRQRTALSRLSLSFCSCSSQFAGHIQRTGREYGPAGGHSVLWSLGPGAPHTTRKPKSSCRPRTSILLLIIRFLRISLSGSRKNI